MRLAPTSVLHHAAATASPPRRWRRFLVVVAATTLPGTALAGAASASTAQNYVAMGDSYTAGSLIPDLTGSPPGCLRSSHDYPALVAGAIGAGSFADVSCQGATTENMSQPQSVPFGINPPQLDALSSSTTLVTVGIGGNDLGFASIVIHCASLSWTDPLGAPCEDHYTSGGTDQLTTEIDATAAKIAAVLQAIHQRAPNARVLLVGYPDILPNTGYGCWPLVPIAFGDVPYLRGVEYEMNQMLASEAAAGNATFVDTYTDSIGHDFCQPTGVKWIEGIVPTSPAAPVHPNALGENAMAQQIEAVVS
jgi:lysophospholipase L1-like esterase